MRKFLIIVLFSCTINTLIAQKGPQDKINIVLENVERNNSTLKAYQKEMDAVVSDGTTGIYADPEVGFTHLWGKEGNEKDISINQSFDFPTVYRQKNRIADGRTKQTEVLYLQKRQEVLQEAREICVNLIYQNKVEEEYTERLNEAEELFNSYEKMLKEGEINILEYNKAKLNYLNIRKGYKTNLVQLEFLNSELTRLNGGAPIEFKMDTYPFHILPNNFDEWFEHAENNNNSLKVLEQEIGISKDEEKLAKGEALPKFSLGYSGEFTPAENMHGVVVGMSVPLWANKNKVKYRKALTASLLEQHRDMKLQFLHVLKSAHSNAVNLLSIKNGYRETLDTMTDQELLKKALDRGELSLIDYLSELVDYHDAMNSFLEVERDYELAFAVLKMYE